MYHKLTSPEEQIHLKSKDWIRMVFLIESGPIKLDDRQNHDCGLVHQSHVSGSTTSLSYPGQYPLTAQWQPRWRYFRWQLATAGHRYELAEDW